MGDSVQIFVSYSRRDEKLVTQLVKLVRAMERSVFWDQDSLDPGARWRDQLSDSINTASHLLVFWCKHAATSDYVGLEIEQATNDPGKRVIPVLLDSTPLAPVLSEYQYIDLREVVPREHGATLRRRLFTFGFAALIGLAVVGSWVVWQMPTETMRGSPSATTDVPLWLWLVGPASAAIAAGVILWFRRQRRLKQMADSLAGSIRDLASDDARHSQP